MKKLNILTPLSEKTQHNASRSVIGRNLRKSAGLLSLMLCLFLTACSPSEAEETSTNTTEESAPQISSFNNYDWGTPYDDIKTSEISSDMKEILDYREENGTDGMVGFSVFNQEAAGYTTTTGYAFFDDKLTAGSYDMDGVDEEKYADLLEKITAEYGEPNIEKDSTGWGRLSVWVDDSKNVICLSEILDVRYIESGSQYLNFLNDQFIKFHEIDLISELDVIGNTDGL